MHSHEIMHRDIKPENIMRRADGSFMFVDFGFAKESRGGRGTNARSEGYDHPVLRVADCEYQFEVDIYALLMTLGNMLSYVNERNWPSSQLGELLVKKLTEL